MPFRTMRDAGYMLFVTERVVLNVCTSSLNAYLYSTPPTCLCHPTDRQIHLQIHFSFRSFFVISSSKQLLRTASKSGHRLRDLFRSSTFEPYAGEQTKIIVS